MHGKKALVIGLMIGIHGGASFAQAVRPEEAIRYRKAVMVMTKWHYDRLSQQAKGAVPFVREEADRHAAWLEALSKNAAEGFVAGSQEGGETKASPAIWSDSAKFRGLVERFQADSGKLRETVRHGEPAAIKTQLDNLARTCKVCHDDFKKS
jgi:cytochrome c556